MSERNVHESRVLKRFFRASLGFGIFMGMVFPLYALMFASFANTAALVFFSLGCVVAGLIVGLSSWLIGKKLILDWLENRTQALGLLGRESSVLDLNASRELGELSIHFTHFFVALDKVLRELRETDHLAHEGMTELSAVLDLMKTQLENLEIRSGEGKAALATLTTRMALITSEGLRLAKTGSRLVEGLAQEQESFGILDDCGAQVNETQKELSLTIEAGLVRSRLMGLTVDQGSTAFNALKEMQERLAQVISLLMNLGTTLEESAAKSSLLAMNTAIEAARAGESGKGFSVIATEMGVQSSMTSEHAGRLTRDLDSLRKDLAEGTKAIDAADRVFCSLRQNVDENLSAMADMDRLAGRFLSSGVSLGETLGRFRELILSSGPLASEFAENSRQYARLSDTSDSMKAGATLGQLLDELQGLKQSRINMTGGLQGLRSTLAGIDREMDRFRLLEDKDD